ncbi:hypothetical protein HY379_00650 [Candidatus Saccharibacteria bacterium]|nr:hypothetical protein [Candidatus Saccharibacteria bacterium]
MNRPRGGHGYTIVEVLIVLVVSLVIFFAAVTVFSGKQGKTEFAQAMRDVESRIQSAVNDVRVSTFPGEAANYTCTIDGGSQRPKLTSPSSQPGTNTACIFLGNAVQLVPNSGSSPDQLKVYTVLGNRTEFGSNVAVTNFNDVEAEPIMGLSGNPDLTQTYTIIFGMKVLSAHQDVPPTNGDAFLMGFYNGLQPTGSAEGSQSLKTIGYVGVKNYTAPGQIQTSIRGLGPATKADSKVWTMCFQSGTSNETAQLVVNSSFAGVTTKVSFISCT